MEPSPLIYYKLRCETCDEDYKPLLATQPGEMLYPEYDETCGECGRTRELPLLDSLRRFHEKHQGHNLVEVTEEVNATT